MLSPTGEVVGRRRYGQAPEYDHKDLLGSTRAVVTASGALVDGRAPDPWGVEMEGLAPRGSASGTLRSGFTSKERLAETSTGGRLSALDDFGARTYASAYGRFLQVDPLAAQMPSWSPYTYAFDNPIGFVDPDGKAPVCPSCDSRQNQRDIAILDRMSGGSYSRDRRRAMAEGGRVGVEIMADTYGDAFELVTGRTVTLQEGHRGYALAGLLLPGVSSRVVRGVSELGHGWLRASGSFDHIAQGHIGLSHSELRRRAARLDGGEASTFVSERTA